MRARIVKEEALMSSAAMPASYFPSVLPGLEVRRVMLLLAVLTFLSGASIKDVLPVRPLAGSIHFQDLIKAAVFLGAGLYGIARLPNVLRFTRYWPAILGWILGAFCLVTSVLAYNAKFALLGSGLLALMMLFLPAALDTLGRVRTLTVLLHSLTAFLFVSIVVFLLFPSHGLLHESEGVRLAGLAHSNGVGQIAGMLVIAALCLHDVGALSTRQVARYVLLALLCLLWAQSRMPLAATLLTLVFYLWRKGTVNAAAVVRTIIILGALGLTLAASLFIWECIPKRPGEKQETLLTRSGDESELRTLTGRDVIWAFARQHIAERPLFGHGYGCSLLVFSAAYERGDLFLNYGSAHNLLLEAALNFGWFGAGLIALSFAALWTLLLFKPATFPDLTILFLSLVGVTEAVLLGPVPGPATMYWLLALHWRIPLRGEASPAQQLSRSSDALALTAGRPAPC
jgi:O-antigen ligase